MVAADFDAFLETLIREYAQDHVRTGQWRPEEGLTRAREETRQLLPAGRATPNHW